MGRGSISERERSCVRQRMTTSRASTCVLLERKSRSRCSDHHSCYRCGAIKEVPMAKFVVIAGFTDQGIRNVKETVSRAEAFKEMAKKSGVTVKDMYWTLGQYDVIAICEAPDDEAATALSLSVCSRGNVRSQTLRAFSFDEMKTILGKMV